MNAVVQISRNETKPVLLVEQIQKSTDSLLEILREALLEARDITDVQWIRSRTIRRLNDIYSEVPVMKDEYVLLKLSALEEIERESIVGHMGAVTRSNKWRRALVDRYFPAQ